MTPGRSGAQSRDLLRVANLCKRYGASTAVDDLSFSITPGECLSLSVPDSEQIRYALEPGAARDLDMREARIKERIKERIAGLLQFASLSHKARARQWLARVAGAGGLRGRRVLDCAGVDTQAI